MKFNLASNTSTTEVTWGGGVGVIAYEGTWDTGTITAQYRLHSDMSWTELDTTTTVIADYDTNFELPKLAKIRFTMSGAGSDDVDIYLLGETVETSIV